MRAQTVVGNLQTLRKFLVVIATLGSIGCGAASDVKKKVKGAVEQAFDTPKEAQKFAETKLADVVGTTLASAKISVLEHVGQVSAATPAPYLPLAVVGLGEKVDVNIEVWYHHMSTWANRFCCMYARTYGNFSGAVTDVDGAGTRHAFGEFAQGRIEVTFEEKPSVVSGVSSLKVSGDAVFALTGQGTDHVDIVIKGTVKGTNGSVNIDARATIANDTTVIQGKVGGQTIEATEVDTSSATSGDTDRDSVRDDIDNCPANFNFNQADLDQDKKGDACDDDADADTHLRELDCNDMNAAIYPGATEIASNGIDEDCSGADLLVYMATPAIQLSPAALTSTTTASFTFSCAEAGCTLQCKLDAAAFATCTSPANYSGLTPGQHSFEVRTVGIAPVLNSPATAFSWSIYPETTVTPSRSGVTTATNISLVLSCSAATCTYQCKLDQASYTTCASGVSFTALPDGARTVTVRATSGGIADATPVVHSWTIDSTPPNTVISTTFSENVTTATTSIAFSCTGESLACTFQCAYSTEVYGSCSNPTEITHTHEGYNYLWVKATDSVGLTDATPAYLAWTVAYPVTGPATSVTAAVSAGAQHSCAVSTDGKLYCWGSGYTQLPDRVGTASNWRFVTAGEMNTCAIKTNNDMYCWGENTNYQLGTGDNGTHNSPTLIGVAGEWKTVSLGNTHTCGIKTEGTLWCWGDNGVGQVGDGTTTEVQTVTKIGTDIDWATVSVGSDHSCAIKTGGTMYCWGYNNMGQLGIGNTTQKLSPFLVGTDVDWAQLALRGSHSCAIKTGGGLYCWGDNTNDQLGLGSYPNSPLRVGTDTWLQVDTDYDHTCGVTTAGTLWCWGNDGSEELGNGLVESNKTAPFQVGSATNWASTAVGYGHSIGIAGSSFYGWGDNTVGQVGDGSFSMPFNYVADPSVLTLP